MGGRFSDEIIEAIRSKNDLLDTVSCYVTLKKTGRNYQGLCPFHSERSPSFSVSPDKGLWYCFGCGTGGDVFDFVKKIENISFMEATKLLAERSGIDLPEEDYSENYKKKKDLYSVNELAANFYHWALFKNIGEKGLKYLSDRNITKDTIIKFKIGYAPPSGDSLLKILKKKDYPMTLAQEGGLLRNSGGGYGDYFIDRIIFPIIDLSDRVIGFGGRIIGDGHPKYLNTPETSVFNKGKYLYALNLIKQRKDKTSPVVLTEGYVDVISVNQAGIDGAVASLGTSLTMEQAYLLRKFTDNVLLAYDADTAGISATGRGLGLLENAGLNVKVIMLPDGKDPDAFIREAGSRDFYKLMEKSIDYFDYLITWLEKKNDLNTREGKEGFLKGLEPFMTSLNEPLRRNEYFKIIGSKNLGISEPDLRSRFRINRDKRNLKVPASKMEISDPERLLLRLMLQDGEIMKAVFEKITSDYFSDSLYRKISEICFNFLKNKKDFSIDELINIITDENLRKILAEMILIDDDYPKDDLSVSGLIKTIKDKKLMRRKKEIELMIQERKVSPSDDIYKEYNNIIHYFSGIPKKRREIL